MPPGVSESGPQPGPRGGQVGRSEAAADLLALVNASTKLGPRRASIQPPWPLHLRVDCPSSGLASDAGRVTPTGQVILQRSTWASHILLWWIPSRGCSRAIQKCPALTPTPVCPSTCFTGGLGRPSQCHHRHKRGQGPGVAVGSQMGVWATGSGNFLVPYGSAQAWSRSCPFPSYDASWPPTDPSGLRCPRATGLQWQAC